MPMMTLFNYFRVRNSDSNVRTEGSATRPVVARIIRASNAGDDLATIANRIEPPRGGAVRVLGNLDQSLLQNVQGTAGTLTRSIGPLRSEPTRINTFGTADANQLDSQEQSRRSDIGLQGNLGLIALLLGLEGLEERELQETLIRFNQAVEQGRFTELERYVRRAADAGRTSNEAAERSSSQLAQTIDKCAITAGELLKLYPNIGRVKLPIMFDDLGSDPDLKIVLMMDGEIVVNGLRSDGYRIFEADDLKKYMAADEERSPVSRNPFDSNSVARLQDEKIVDARGEPLDLTIQLLS